MPPNDFGVTRRKRPPTAALTGVGLTIGVLLLIASFAPKILADQRMAIADAAEWTIAGPPCREVDAAAFHASPYEDRRKIEYGGVRFGRNAGHVSCAFLRPKGGRALFGGYPVCQFTSPAVLSVEAEKARAFYLIGLSQRATVSLASGRPACVLAGKFSG